MLTPVPHFGAAALPPIFIADDDPDDLYFAKRLIKRTGTRHPVITFDNGASVTDYLTRAWLENPFAQPELLPRLLFLDLKMNGLGGFAFLEWIAKHKELAAINVVVLSGSDEWVDVERAKALGAKRYLAKHPSASTFARIIAHVYGDSAVAFESLPQPDADDFFTGCTTEGESGRLGRRGSWTPLV